MADYFLSGRAALDDALQLVDEYGREAPAVAAERANVSRDRENVRGFCHWRQIERLLELLDSPGAVGMIH